MCLLKDKFSRNMYKITVPVGLEIFTGIWVAKKLAPLSNVFDEKQPLIRKPNCFLT